MRMFSLVRRLSGPMVAAGIMAVLLGVMAVLQYRWVGQLSADERDRTTAHLQRRADAFADDFNRELTRAFFWLQVGPEIRRDRRVESDEERYERWYTTAPRPDLIKTIYRLKLDPDDRREEAVRLEMFERAPARLERAEWPAALAPIRARLEEGIAEHRTDGSRPVRVPLVWSDIPAIVIPRVQVQDRGQLRVAMPGTGYTIALLDEGVIVRELIPMLAERHFGQGQDASVFAAVVGPRGPIYTAPEGKVPDALLAKPDAKFDLFEIRFGEFNRFVIERRPDGSMTSNSAQTRGSIRFTEERRGGPFRGAGPPPPPASWHVHLLHGAGSVDAAVARARWRNLLVSFGVLLLLGASMGLVLVTTGRARRLAAQQMEFVAGVSHELRTPLAVIRSAAENLADGVVSEPKQVRRYGEVITAEGRRLTQMVEQIMEFAGFASGRATLDVRPAEVGSILEDALPWGGAASARARRRDRARRAGVTAARAGRSGCREPIPAEPHRQRAEVRRLASRRTRRGDDRARRTARRSADHRHRQRPRHRRTRFAAHLRAVLSRRRCDRAPDSWKRSRLEPRQTHHGRHRRARQRPDRSRQGQRIHPPSAGRARGPDR